MTREEMLVELHNINIGAQPVVATFDMGLEYEYVTPEGHGESFGNMGDWPAYEFKNLTKDALIAIQAKIKNASLTVSDLEGTEFAAFYKYVFSVERPESYVPTVSDFFKDLMKISLDSEGSLYALCDARDWQPSVAFFSTYVELEDAFAYDYISYIEEWEELSDDELADWIFRIDTEFGSIPCNNLK